MNLRDVLRKDLTDAIHAGDKKRIATLRMLFAAITNKEIEERKKDVGLAEEEVQSVVQKEAKKRKDAIVEFEKGGRMDLAQNEKEELKILEGYLPKELSDEEILRVVRDGIREVGGPDEKKFGELMKVIMPTLKGRASGERITSIARSLLRE